MDAPFAAGASRYENGAVMAGPDCKFTPGCQNIATQSLAIFNRLGDVQTRVVAVDERMGIVWLRMAWGVRERGGAQLTVWESFKVCDGKIHAVEAFAENHSRSRSATEGGSNICSADTIVCGRGKTARSKDSSLRTPLARPIGRRCLPCWRDTGLRVLYPRKCELQVCLTIWRRIFVFASAVWYIRGDLST